MAKAHVTTRDGTKITIEGSDEEIASLLARLQGPAAGEQPRPTSSRARPKTRSTPVGVVMELVESGFFKKPKELRAIKDALEEQGHFYPVTTLSPTVLRLVKKKELRRIKDGKRWAYVG